MVECVCEVLSAKGILILYYAFSPFEGQLVLCNRRPSDCDKVILLFLDVEFGITQCLYCGCVEQYSIEPGIGRQAAS